MGCLAALAAPSSAHAEEAPSGTYNVRLKEVQNSCTGTGIRMDKNQLVISRRGEKNLRLALKGVPELAGRATRGGKFQGEAKKGTTAIKGLDGAFSVAGRTKGNTVRFVLIAEFFRGESPHCTQSWNATGTRAAAQ